MSVGGGEREESEQEGNDHWIIFMIMHESNYRQRSCVWIVASTLRTRNTPTHCRAIWEVSIFNLSLNGIFVNENDEIGLN